MKLRLDAHSWLLDKCIVGITLDKLLRLPNRNEDPADRRAVIASLLRGGYLQMRQCHGQDAAILSTADALSVLETLAGTPSPAPGGEYLIELTKEGHAALSNAVLHSLRTNHERRSKR